MPIDEYVAHDLLAWYEVTPYKKPFYYAWATDANRAGAKRGKQPVWLGAVMRDYIQPAARKLGINKKMSWHTFSMLLKGNGEDVKVVQELLRHSTAKMTSDTYTQTLSPQKRAAQSNVVGMIRSKPSCTVVVPRVSGEIPERGRTPGNRFWLYGSCTARFEPKVLRPGDLKSSEAWQITSANAASFKSCHRESVSL